MRRCRFMFPPAFVLHSSDVRPNSLSVGHVPNRGRFLQPRIGTRCRIDSHMKLFGRKQCSHCFLCDTEVKMLRFKATSHTNAWRDGRSLLRGWRRNGSWHTTSSSNSLISILIVGNEGICQGACRQSVRFNMKSQPPEDSVRSVKYTVTQSMWKQFDVLPPSLFKDIKKDRRGINREIKYSRSREIMDKRG